MQWQVNQSGPGVMFSRQQPQSGPTQHSIPEGWRVRRIDSPFVIIESDRDTLKLPANAKVEVSEAVDWPILDTSGSVLKVVVPPGIKVEYPGQRPATPQPQAKSTPQAKAASTVNVDSSTPKGEPPVQPALPKASETPKASASPKAAEAPKPAETEQAPEVGPALPKPEPKPESAEPYLQGFFRQSTADTPRVWIDPSGHPWQVREGTIYSRPKAWEGITVPPELAKQFEQSPQQFLTGVDAGATRKTIQAAQARGIETVTKNAPRLGLLASEAEAETGRESATIEVAPKPEIPAASGIDPMFIYGGIVIAVAAVIAMANRKPQVVVAPTMAARA